MMPKPPALQKGTAKDKIQFPRHQGKESGGWIRGRVTRPPPPRRFFPSFALGPSLVIVSLLACHFSNLPSIGARAIPGCACVRA